MAVAAFQSASLKARLAPLYSSPDSTSSLDSFMLVKARTSLYRDRSLGGQEVADRRRGLPSHPVGQIAAGRVGVDGEDPVAAHRGSAPIRAPP